MAVFFDSCCWEYRKLVLDVVEPESGTAESLVNEIREAIAIRKIPAENFIGFCADTTNVMFGNRGGAAAILKDSFDHKILTVKCSCHSANMTASWSCKK